MFKLVVGKIVVGIFSVKVVLINGTVVIIAVGVS